MTWILSNRIFSEYDQFFIILGLKESISFPLLTNLLAYLLIVYALLVWVGIFSLLKITPALCMVLSSICISFKTNLFKLNASQIGNEWGHKLSVKNCSLSEFTQYTVWGICTWRFLIAVVCCYFAILFICKSRHLEVAGSDHIFYLLLGHQMFIVLA